MTQPDHLGKYRILREIGRGGFSIVYQAVDPTLGDRPVALKVLHPFLLVDPEFVARFRREATVVANLNHPNIAHIYEVGELEGTLFIAMEYLAGPALDEALKDQGAFPPGRAAAIIAQIAAALDYAHGRGLIHRDVKPGNIILCEGDRAVLTDFGLARAMEGSLLTSTGQLLGTPEYMSPEQAEAAADTPLDARTDVYSLGVVAYELLTGRPPFTGQWPSAVLYKVVHEPPPPPLQVNPSLPAEVGDVLLKVLAKRREDRCQTAGAFAQALQEAVEAPALAAQRERELATLYAQAEQQITARDWTEAVSTLERLAALDARYQNTKTLLSRARAEAQKRDQMEQRYQAGLKLITEQRWAEAIAALEPVVMWNADYREAEAKLTMARQRLAQQERGRRMPVWVWVSGGLTTLGLVALLIACLVTLVGAKVIGEWPTSTQMVARATSTIDINLLAKNTSVPSIPTHTLVPPLTLIPTPRPAGTSVSLTATPTATTKPTPKPTPTMRLTAPPTVIRWEKDGKEMVLVPAGEFLMGSLAGEGEDDEHPQHRVYLDAFYMDKTEVTNAEYKRFVDATGYRAPDLWTWGNANGQIPVGLENHPVWVSWEDAAAYARWAGKRLPTEAEWEKTARGTDGRTYPWGNDWDPAKANTFEVAVGQGKTTPVGNYPAGVSPYGVLDMAGNLWEWCADWYSEDYYGRSPASNPTGPVSGIDRVLRGGSCLFPHLYARCAYRSRDNPALRKGDYGFRCCLSSTSLP